MISTTKLSAHNAIIILDFLNKKKIDFCKLPDGTLITRIDCEEALAA